MILVRPNGFRDSPRKRFRHIQNSKFPGDRPSEVEPNLVEISLDSGPGSEPATSLEAQFAPRILSETR